MATSITTSYQDDDGSGGGGGDDYDDGGGDYFVDRLMYTKCLLIKTVWYWNKIESRNRTIWTLDL